MDLDTVIAEVAGAVGLAEGEPGVRDILRVIAGAEPAPARELGRQAELPVPIVTAVCDELRKRGVVCTDPPYTVAGAELFLSRAVTVLEPGPGRHVFFSFGARRPAETLRTQQLIAGLGLTVRALLPGFNAYLGAGILSGTSNLYHLRTTVQTAPLISADYDGPLYTADTRPLAVRPYQCAGCAAVHQVGPGTRWPTIAALQAESCPDCGATTFRPMPRQQR